MRHASSQSRSSYYAPDTLARPPHWGENAACRTSKNPDIWFADGDGPEELADRSEAKRVCGTCPARSSCLTDALMRGEPVGVCGGLDTEERTGLIPYRPSRKTAPTEEATGGAPPAQQAATA